MKTIAGKVLNGTTVNSHKFQGVTTLNQIEDYGLLRPTYVAKVTKRSGGDEHDMKAREMHEEVQRRFDKARINRATIYSGYIERVEVHGGIGGTPAITMFYNGQLEETENGIVIPYSAILSAIDGETQTEARYMLRDRLPETGDSSFAITLYHNLPVDAAKQILHDYNSLGKPVTEAQTFAFNKAGKLTVALNKAIELSGADEKHFNRNGAKATKKTVVAHKQMLNALAGYVLNGVGGNKTAGSSFKELNHPGANDVPEDGIAGVATFVKSAFNNPVIGSANAQVWQMAGVLLSKGRTPESINWQGGVTAYEQTMTAGRGGERIPVKDRLSRIEQAM